MVQQEYICLSKIAAKLWRTDNKIDQDGILEFLRKGELKAIIQFPASLQSYDIPRIIWENLPDDEFVVRVYKTIGNKRSRRPKLLEISTDFAVTATIQRLRGFLEGAIAENPNLLDELRQELGEMCKIECGSNCWASIRNQLIDRIISVSAQRDTFKRVYVRSKDFEDFKTRQKIKVGSSAGRQRIATKDDMIIEILKRYYNLSEKPGSARKNRAPDIKSWMTKTYSKDISESSVKNILICIDQLLPK